MTKASSTGPPKSKRASGWIARQVSFATYKKNDQGDAGRLTESLNLLARGVKHWNAWREGHPEFHPYLANTNLSWTNGHITDLTGINLSNANLEDVDFVGQALYDADLTGASLQRADLTDAGLERASLAHAELQHAELTEAHLGFANLNDADMTGANLTDSELWSASLQGTNLRGAVLDGAEASGVHAMGADLSFARLLDADFEEADLSGADLTYATLVRTKLRRASLAGAKVYGVSAWDVDVDMADQSGLILNEEGQSPVLVDDIEVAQFVHLLLNHNKLRKAINAVAERGVLILGRFASGGLEVLEALSERLRDLKYLPIIFDFGRPASRNYTETVVTLAGLSRFVVADLSGRSVPQELYATVPHFKIPFVPILQAHRKAHSMVADLMEYPWVIKPILEFGSKEQLKDLVATKIVAPAEEKHHERQLLLQRLFH